MERNVNGYDATGARHGRFQALRSILVGIVVVAFFGIIGAVVSYRADVSEARRQVRERVARQVRASADALAQRFNLLSTELLRIAHHSWPELAHPNQELLAVMRDDESLFAGGTALLSIDGSPLWVYPKDALAGVDPQHQSWFQHVLGTEQVAVDSIRGEESPRVVVAAPVRDRGRLVAVLIGVVIPQDSLLTTLAGEQLFAVARGVRVVIPRSAPAWTQSVDFRGRLTALRDSPHEGTWRMDDEDLIAEVYPVQGTALEVLAVESETVSVEAIRRRLNLQLVFLSVLQVVTLSAFFFFLRSIYRAFLEVEARVAEQEKLAALGTAASLIAHEVKNSLNGLKGATSLLEIGGDAALASKTIRGQVERLGHLASSLLSFAKPTVVQRIPVAVDSVVRDTVHALHALPEFEECRVTVDLADGAHIDSDPLLLVTAADNLIRNAIEAAIAAKDTGKTDDPWVSVKTERAGARVRLSVEDNAGGPPPGFEARLGEPFYTTKSRGIGLGVAMTRRAVEQLGGTLTFVRTEVGSRFIIELPESKA